MIQGALGNIKHDFLLRDWITQQKMEEKKKKKKRHIQPQVQW